MFRLRTTTTLSALVLIGAVGMSLWMSAWPRMHDRATEAAVAARQQARVKTHEPPARTPHQRQPPQRHVAIQTVQAAPPSPPAPTYAPSPAYPMEALSAQREGVVTLRVSVDGAGAVTAVDVVHSSGVAVLDASALETMREWRFQAPDNHQPMTFDYPLAFRIGPTTP